MKRSTLRQYFLLTFAWLAWLPLLDAQAVSGRAGAPWDMTGYWVSLITDDWRYRMLTPPKGNIDMVPVTAEGRRQTEQWDPAKDQANGDQCNAYGAGGIMRLPGRLHMAWENDNTLKMDIDTGTQTRRFLFATPQTRGGEKPTLQGYSVAEWEIPGGGRGAAKSAPKSEIARFGQLKVVTTALLPGYVRKNGIPYSSNAVITENFVHLVDHTDGQEYLAVTIAVDDPKFFQPAYIKTYEFKKQRDAAGWNPTACTVK